MDSGGVDVIRSCLFLPLLSFSSLKLEKKTVDLGVPFPIKST